MFIKEGKKPALKKCTLALFMQQRLDILYTNSGCTTTNKIIYQRLLLLTVIKSFLAVCNNCILVLLPFSRISLQGNLVTSTTSRFYIFRYTSMCFNVSFKGNKQAQNRPKTKENEMKCLINLIT